MQDSTHYENIKFPFWNRTKKVVAMLTEVKTIQDISVDTVDFDQAAPIGWSCLIW